MLVFALYDLEYTLLRTGKRQVYAAFVHTCTHDTELHFEH